MSLFDEPTAPTVQTPPPLAAPPLDAAAHAAAVAAEKERIRAEDAARSVAPPPPAPAVPFGFCSRCGTPLTGNNASKLPSGELKHMGCSVAAAPPPPAAPSPPTAVNPPDQPRAATMLELAAAVPPHEIAQIDDPEIKATVEEHARQHAEKAAREAAAAEAAKIAAGAAVWCAVSTTKVVITTEMALARKFVCQCGKEYSIKTLKPVKEGDLNVSVIPRHKLPKKDGEVAAAPPPPAEKQIRIIDETNSGDEADDDEGDDVVEFAPPPPPAATTDLHLAGITTPPAPPVAVAPPPPPPPPPTQANVLVESGRTSYEDARVSNPPRANVPPPPTQANVLVESGLAALDAIGVAKSSTNGNGHTNGHALEMPVPPLPLPVITTTGKLRAFHVEAHINVDGTRTAKKRVVLAGSAREAMTKIEESFGAAFIEVRWIKVIVGAVIS